MPEVKRSVVGNSADEFSAHDAGMDFGSVNVSMLPESRPDAVVVDAEYVSGDGLTLTPKEDRGGFHRALGELHEGPVDQLSAQLLEEPDTTALAIRKVHGIEVEGNASRLEMVSRRSPREELVWYGMHPEYYGAVAGDRIMLRRDILESQYSCKACKGLGYDESAICGNCGGHATETVTTDGGTAVVPCRVCRVAGYSKETWYSCGRHKCTKCNGSGWRGGIVIPEESQSQAITGVVVSVGPDCRTWKIGDRLLFSRFAGHTLEVSKTESFIMMRESEALGMLRQRNEKL